jgi:hypothetical protein
MSFKTPSSKPKYPFTRIECSDIYQAQAAYQQRKELVRLLHVVRLEIWAEGCEYAIFESPDLGELPARLDWA